MSTKSPQYVTPPSVVARIVQLPELPMGDIKSLWKELFPAPIPWTHVRQFLERRIAYRSAGNEFRR